MKLTNNTILITGGSSGIGLQLVRELSGSNKIIVAARNAERLGKVKEKFPNVVTIQADLAEPAQVDKLIETIKNDHPDLNLLINNAAIVHNEAFAQGENMTAKATKEMQINFLAPVALTEGLLPLLNANPNPHIVNVTTGLVYIPRAVYPFYNATKAALNSFTKVLRKQLEDTPIRVIEALFPAVDTPWHGGNPPKIAIPVEQAVAEMLNGLRKGSNEIKIGGVKLLYKLSRLAPAFAFRKMNSIE
jgi:uncharacterized oxidoreductase